VCVCACVCACVFLCILAKAKQQRGVDEQQLRQGVCESVGV